MADKFSQVPRGVIVQFALSLDLPEILALCQTSKRFNRLICDNKTFWINRLLHVYDISIKDIPTGYTPKSYYAYITNKLLGDDLDQVLKDASEKGELNLVRIALNKGADPAAHNNFAIREASENGHTGVVKLLLADNRTDPAANNNYAIRFASLNGHIEVVKLLLTDNRVDPTAQNNHAIRWTSRNGHPEVVRLFLADPKVDPAAKNNQAIRWARRNGHTEVVKLLLNSNRVDPVAR